MKKINLLYAIIIALFFFFSLTVNAQRKMEKMDRGLVAMPKSTTQMYISWRHFATDPDDIAYNVYYKTSEAGALTKLNNTPITNSTNYTATLSTSSNNYTFVVKSVLNNQESDEPGSFTVPRNTVISRIVRDFNFRSIAGLENIQMPMKFCWPADLNGDGKYDFVLDRQNYGAVAEDGSGGSSDYPSPKVEAYTSEGVFLWRVDMGHNIKICNGHADMVTAYDMDGDGKAEVLMMVSEGTTFADGTVVLGANGQVTDYRSRAGSAPQWLSILNGETGVEISRTELPYYNEMTTTRSDSWKDITGHFIIAYLDGIYPSLIYQYKNRLANGNFQGAHAAWRFNNGQLSLQWSNRTFGAEFHQVRVGDVNGDGCDEFVEGGYVLNSDGSLLNEHTGVIHGDRHVLTDIDPDRPGLEHFYIQQENPNTLGMGLADPVTGEMIKGIYQSSVGDVGRGTCGAYDATLRGLQFFSTMNGNAMYDCKGNKTSGTGNFPGESLWWDGDLCRELVNSADGAGKNLVINKFSSSSKSIGRILSLYNENNGNGTYYFSGASGARPAFWGDILGDWREEFICTRRDASGFIIISTNEVSDHRLYNLMQNPAYRCQTTAKGYYQTADVDYYLAPDMPAPPIAPVQKADIYYTNAGWIDYNNISQSYADGKSIMFDIRGANSTYTLNSSMSPSRVWLMNPKGKDYTFSGAGKFTGSMDLIKSMQGDVILNGNHDYTGITRISEGRLFINGTLSASKVRVDARGVIGGNAYLNGGIELETGLNIQGGRIEPGNGSALGKIVINGNLTLNGRNNLAFDVNQNDRLINDSLVINGDFTVTGTNNNIVIESANELQPGILTLITYTGTSNATASNFKVVGLEGIPYTLLFEQGKVKMEINESRDAGSVEWQGANSAIWDFSTKNFLYEGIKNIFVPGDIVIFNDNASNKTIQIDETMPVGGLVFNNNTDYTISGNGIISGNGGLSKTGNGSLTLSTSNNTFTGPVIIDGGTLTVSSLTNGGSASSIGASSNESSNWIMKNATLQTSAQMATDRNMQAEGTLTVNNPSGCSVLISGNITGNGDLEVNGAGTLSLQGRNSFSSIKLKSGLLFLSSADGNRYSASSAKVTLLGGTFRLFDINSTSNTGTFTNAIEVPEGSSAKLDLPSRWGISSTLTGGGTIEVNAPYVRTDFNGNWSGFTGIIKFTGSDIRLNNSNARNMPNAEINLGSGTSLYVASNGGGSSSTQTTFTFGALSGAGSISGIHNLVIGNKNTNSTYSGNISTGSGKLTKKGTGSLTLSGNNLYTGGTTIDEGKIIATNSTSSVGTGGVTVNSKGTLMGTGTVLGTTSVNSGGTLMAGSSETTTGTLTFGSNLSLRSGSRTIIKINNSNYDKYTVGGSLILSGTLEIQNLSTSDYRAGRSYTIFTATGVAVGNFEAIEPEIPGPGLIWNTSRLITEGIISIDEDPMSLNNPEDIPVQIYPTIVDDICYVSIGEIDTNAKIELTNQLGVVLQAKQINPSELNHEFNMSSYNAGFYFVKILDNRKSTVHKIIKK